MEEKETVNALKVMNNWGDNYKVINRIIYLLFHLSIRNSKIAYTIQKMDSTATIRNWNTINKLYILANAKADS